MISTLLASGGLLDQLGINPKVLGTQVVIFAITFALLSRILFGRALVFMQNREDEVSRSQESIGRDRAEVARLSKDYEVQIARIDKEAYDRTQALLKEALVSASQTVQSAQAEAKEEVRKAFLEMAQEKKLATEKLRGEVTQLTLSVSEKVLGMRLDPATHGPEIERFVSGRS